MFLIYLLVFTLYISFVLYLSDNYQEENPEENILISMMRAFLSPFWFLRRVFLLGLSWLCHAYLGDKD